MRRVMLSVVLMALLSWGTSPHAAEPLPMPKGPVVLTLSGNIERTNVSGQAQFDMPMLEALGLRSIRTHYSMVDKAHLFEGVALRAVLERVGAKGKVMKAAALNDYQVDIPLDDLQYEPIIAMRADGQALKMRDKGPLWIVYPREAHRVLQDVKYDARWIWQLNRLHIE
jgi:hypothetical protein